MSQLETLLVAGAVRAGETIAPAFQLEAFHCVHCAAYSTHHWVNLQRKRANGTVDPSAVWFESCLMCRGQTYWLDLGGDRPPLMVWPETASAAPLPLPAMPDDVRDDYMEARAIVNRSPRGAAALLRLALQKLMPHLEQPGKDLNADIGALARGGLDMRAQRALDSLRVIGNNAVHPGELSLKDNPETAQGLFVVLNFIVEQLIELPQRLDTIYDSLPQGAKEQIERRDTER